MATRGMEHLGLLDINWKPELKRVESVYEGMPVLAFYDKTTAIKCKVACAAGHHARVVNEKHNFDRWFNISDLRQQEKE